ncbi:WG repeat-containing protein [Leptospira dzoumogneensis]|uniref:WG repeat-containing protein n=1 Tax=Leptospira dzoumogneensis TaxID=2484904 RepID=A0A4Z1ATX9_9LEPT|nr:WG repeat-containing protein [Leptospira dzoumogneensis]TGM99551.1 WG repeat-containing protein [Leptospira dzoumogneensis]
MDRKIYLLVILAFLPLLAFCSKKLQLTAFEENDVYGYKDQNGKVQISPQYSIAYDFNENGVGFSFGKGGWICIDPQNEVLLNVFAFDNGPDEFSEGLARFVENSKFGFFDSSCKKIIAANYDFAFQIHQGFSKVCNDCKSVSDGEHSTIEGGKYGLIDKTGKVIVPIEYDSLSEIDPETKTLEGSKGGVKKEIKLP